MVNLFGLRNTKLVHQTPQILLKSGFFQRNSGNLLNLSNINWQLKKWFSNNCSFNIYVWIDCFQNFVKSLLISAKLKILMLLYVFCTLYPMKFEESVMTIHDVMTLFPNIKRLSIKSHVMFLVLLTLVFD